MKQSNIPITSYEPRPRLLMGAGPSSVHPRVLQAMAQPTIGHLDPQFEVMMEQIKTHLRYLFGTSNHATFPLAAPGSAAMEMCFVSLIEPGDKVVVCQNGVFGGRMGEMARRCGATVVVVQDEWGQPITPSKVDRALRENPDTKVLALVHAETSTGVCSDMAALGKLASAHPCFTVVDAVASLAGIPVQVDAWAIDVAFAAAQKCISGPAGLGPITFSDRAVEFILKRSRVQSWFLDLALMQKGWQGSRSRTYHYTPPINSLYGLHEALVVIAEEGYENVWQRHRDNGELLAQGLEALGLESLIHGRARLPQLTTVTIPEDIDGEAVRQFLLHELDIEISAGLGDLAGKVWRIGIMGNSSNANSIKTCLKALDTGLKKQRNSG